ncbi:hypothetical protein MHYP_G00285750 [Metynnis hypsauchen]
MTKAMQPVTRVCQKSVSGHEPNPSDSSKGHPKWVYSQEPQTLCRYLPLICRVSSTLHLSHLSPGVLR